MPYYKHEGRAQCQGHSEGTDMTNDEAEIVTQAIAIIEKDLATDSDVLRDPQATRDYIRLQVAGLEHEVFGLLYLTTRHQIIGSEILFRGTIDGAAVYPREVVKSALLNNAAAVIVFHNHPSNVCEPSRADRDITKRLQDALSLVDIRILDHIVASSSGSVSLAERGLI